MAPQLRWYRSDVAWRMYHQEVSDHCPFEQNFLLSPYFRSVFLGDITKAYQNDSKLENLLFDNFFNKAIHAAQPGWRRTMSKATEFGIPAPAFATALAFFDGYRTERLPASLLQAQRDFFGAHTYKVGNVEINVEGVYTSLTT